MNIHCICTSCLTLVARTVVSLTEHHGKVAHRRFPFLRHGVSFRREREGVLAFRISQALSKVSHRIVQCQASYGQFRFFGLLLLVLGRTFLGSPFILLLLIHFVHFLHFRSPCVNHGVNATLTRCKITGDVGDEVQRVHLAVNGNLDTRSQHSDGWTDGSNYRKSQCWSHSIQ